MSLTAILQFGDNQSRRYSREYLVTDFKCHVSRHHNESRPDGNPSCDGIELTVVVPGKEDLNLQEWYVDRSVISGRILVELPAAGQNQPSETKEVLFENAVCYALAEEYDINENRRRSLHLSLAVESLTADTIAF